MPKTSTNYRKEFEDEVKRQVAHMTIKRDYLAYRLENDIRDESAQNRAKAKMELDALQHKLDELVAFDTWLNEQKS